MTLIELLVVIVILTTIVGAAIPLMSPSNDDRRLREAARTLNTYITGAQARAISTKRPYGIALKRLSHDTNTDSRKSTDPTKDIHPDNGASLEVFYVEQPPPYAGFDADARACVALHPTRAGMVLVRFMARVARNESTTPGLPVGWRIDPLPSGTIRPHDVIEINGTRFELLPPPVPADPYVDPYVRLDVVTNTLQFFAQRDPNRPAQILARPMNDSGQQINPRYDNAGYAIGAGRDPSPPAPQSPPAPFWALPSPYKVLRQPTPASDEPYQLPEGTAIDLRASGVGVDDYFYSQGLNDNSDNVIIMFAPEGRVSWVSYSQLPNEVERFDKPVVDNIYLLVGRRENIEAPNVSTGDVTLTSAILSVTNEDDRAKLRSKLNWLGGSSRWVVIGSQSGRIATIENAFVDLAGLYTRYVTNGTPPLNSEQLRNQQIQAAREFTREMAQLSGR